MTDIRSAPAKHGNRLMQAGIAMFLLSLLLGLAASAFMRGLSIFAVPRLGLSAHLIGLMQGTFLVAAGAVWPKLKLSNALSRVVVSLLVYGFLAAWIANLLAAVWGAGGAMLPNAGGTARGTAMQEIVIAIALRTGAIAQIASLSIILWGARHMGRE